MVPNHLSAPSPSFARNTKDHTIDENGTIMDNNGVMFHFGKLRIGSIIAMVDNEGSQKFRFGKVLKEANDWHTVQLFAAQRAPKAVAKRSTRLVGKCKFKLAHVDARDSKITFNKRFRPWISPEFDTNERLVIAINLEINARNGTLTNESMGRIPLSFAPILS